jgi:hypothetical protein
MEWDGTMTPTHYHSGVHCSLEQTYDAGDRCPVCLSQAPRSAVYEIQQDPLVVMMRCPHCEGCSASRMPRQETLDTYYKSYYAETDRRVTMGEPSRFARHVAQPMPELQHRSALRILDFGGGDGSLACAIVRQIRQAAGRQIPASIDLVDYEPPGHFAADAITIAGHRDLSEISGSFDLILASAILEHIPSVHATITRLIAAASTGTFMYARTPYILPFAAIFSGLDTTYPAHVHDMGSAFWGKFVGTFQIEADLIRSAPSFVETTFSQAPLRTALAHLLKSPAHVEVLLGGRGRVPKWKWVGGWEATIRFR